MPSLLAQAAPDAALGSWLSVAIIVIGGLGTLTNIVAIFATRREVESLQKRVETLEVRIDSFAHEFGDATRQLSSEIGDLKQEMPMQIVALLRNTGNLK